jgi:hypothetical protein
MTTFEMIKQELEELEAEIDTMEIEQMEEEVYRIERQINDFKSDADEEDWDNWDSLSERITRIKEENNFFDSEAELDRMFPDRHEPGFDEDSMSYDSVFGDE